MTDFYLSSSDSGELNTHPRACTIIAVVRTASGNGVLVNLTPPLPGALFRSQHTEIKRVVLAPRFATENIEHPEKWPVYVYVLELAVEDRQSVVELREGDYEIAAWGDVLPTEEAALAYTYDMDGGDQSPPPATTN